MTVDPGARTPDPAAPTTLLRVATLSQLTDPALVAVTAPSGEAVCLIRRGGTVTAARDECPHAAFPLSAGEVLADGTLQCSWHGARFDCASGAVCAGPATDALAMYEVRVQGDDVLLGGPR